MSDTSTTGSSLDFGSLRQANLARAKEWNPTGADTGPGFAGLELAGEVGELCNLIKKAERVRLGLKGGSVAPERIAEELADVVICADLVGIALGIDLSDAVRTKFNATSQEKGFTTQLESATTLAEQRDALLELVLAYQAAGDVAPLEGHASLASLRAEEAAALRGRHVEDRCLHLGIDLDRDPAWAPAGGAS